MKSKYDEYKSKLNHSIEESNVELQVNVNWKVVAIVSMTVGSLLFFGIMFVNNLITYNAVVNEQNKIVADIKKVNEDIESLKTQQEQSKSLEFVEKQAREKLKMVKDYETVYIDLAE